MSFPVSVSMCSHLEGFCVQRHAWLRGLSVRGVFAHSAAMIGKIPKSSQMKFSSQSLRGKKKPNYIDNCSVPFSNQSWFLAQRKKRVWRKSVEVSMKWHVGHIKILGWIDTLMFYLRHGDGSGWRKKKKAEQDERRQEEADFRRHDTKSPSWLPWGWGSIQWKRRWGWGRGVNKSETAAPPL